MLTGNEIRIKIASGGLDVKPYDEACIGPNSYDVHLGDQLVVYLEAVLDAKQENRTRTITIPEDGIVLQPGRLYLGKTMEWTSSPGFVPMYEGRSSLGRLGVSSHITAGFGDIGFEGNWTLEISVVQPVRIYPGMRIGQLYWHKPVGEITSTYHGKYQGQEDIQASKLYEDFEEEAEKMKYWDNITAINDRQEAKGQSKYGEQLEENVTLTIIQRIEHAEEEAIDLLKYLEHLKQIANDGITANDYQRAALRTASGMNYENHGMLMNGILGLCGETGEVADLVKKATFQGHELYKEHVAEELGDVAWYLAVAAYAIGYNLGDIFQGNVDKLKKRYPDGFDKSRSINGKCDIEGMDP